MYSWMNICCRFVDKNSGVPKEMDMGGLFDSLSGNGFVDKRKRSEAPNRNGILYDRYSARFRTIPDFESEDSD